VIETGARRTVWPAEVAWHPALGSSPAVTAGGWVFTSNHLPTDYVHAIAPEAAVDPAAASGTSAVERQTEYVLAALGRTLAASGADLRTDAVRMHWWLRSARPTPREFERGGNWTGIEDLAPLHEARERAVAQPQPGSTGIGVRGLLSPEAAIAAAVIAIPADGDARKRAVDAPTDMAQIPDTPAVRHGDWIFTVGVIASDWRGDFGADLNLGAPSFVDPNARVNPFVWFGSAVEAQVDAILDTLEAIADAEGTSLRRCVKAEVYFGHADDLYAIERAWRRRFPSNPPARLLVPYSGLAGRGCRVEIALTLLAGEAPIEAIETSEAPEPVWHEPQAVRAGGLVFLSTQAPFDEQGKVPADLHDGPLTYLSPAASRQARYLIGNVARICEAAGTSLDQVCRRSTFFGVLGDFHCAAAEWSRGFDPAGLPASIDVGVGRGNPLLAPNVRMLTDVVAYVP
jgi:enamine deaminase RidA (YjgF/YER057c/UK114 family)